MAVNNIHKLFFQDYYEGIKWGFVTGSKDSKEQKKENKSNKENISKKNDNIKSEKLIQIHSSIKESVCNKLFELKVLYPGLVTGTGLVHDSKKIEGGYNLGMHFDYTYGMPIVYGSSVKGVLREYFKEFMEDSGYGEDQIKELFNAIFEGKRTDGSNLPMYERDVFFDAVITSPEKGFLANDSITPHTQGPYKDPVPITMLKIAPGCKLEFRFLLHDTDIQDKNGEIFTADRKRDIFKEILTTVGVGAKTNVGYGQLKEV